MGERREQGDIREREEGEAERGKERVGENGVGMKGKEKLDLPLMVFCSQQALLGSLMGKSDSSWNLELVPFMPITWFCTSIKGNCG